MRRVILNRLTALAVISDTHFGSKFSLFPPEWKTREGQKIKASKQQLKIWKFWNFFLKKCNEFDVEYVIHLGDIIHGLHPKDPVENVLVPKINDQMELACEVLSMIKTGKRKLITVNGSLGHEVKYIKITEEITKRLGGTFGGFCSILEFEKFKKRFYIEHEETSAMIYSGTALDRAHIFMKLAQAKRKIPEIDWLLCGHLHHFHSEHCLDFHSVIAPCWTGFTPYYKGTGLFGKKMPDIGGIILFVDNERRVILLHFIMEDSLIENFEVKIK